MRDFWTKIFNINYLIYTGSIVVLIYLIFSLNNSLDKLNQLKTSKAQIEIKNAKLKEEIEKIEREIEYIKYNPSYYIKVAREEFFYLKPEEYLFVVISKERVDAQTLKKEEGKPKGSGKTIKD
ncbi:MAG: septum formation initiator family protein [Thermoanaerobaculia bacterium]